MSTFTEDELNTIKFVMTDGPRTHEKRIIEICDRQFECQWAYGISQIRAIGGWALRVYFVPARPVGEWLKGDTHMVVSNFLGDYDQFRNDVLLMKVGYTAQRRP